MFMFHNETLFRDKLNFKDMCPLTQKEQIARIAFNQGFGIVVDYHEMSETGKQDMSWSLVRSGGNTKIPRDWEILKLFFTVNNIVPTWIDCTGVDTLYSKENGSWSGRIGKV